MILNLYMNRFYYYNMNCATCTEARKYNKKRTRNNTVACESEQKSPASKALLWLILYNVLRNGFIHRFLIFSW